MKLRKTLTVNGKPVPIVQDDVRLNLQAPGQAMFVVRSGAALAGVVRFSIGYSCQKYDQLYFTGSIQTSRTVDAKQQRLQCRELTAILHKNWPLALRHPCLRDVLHSYAVATKLPFIIPEQPYAERRVPCFQPLGSGIHGLDSLGGIFGIADYMWNQQADGRVFVGSWQDSRWADKPVQLEEPWFRKVGNTGNRTIPAIPLLRPGVQLNGEFVTKVQLVQHEMVVTCSKSLNELF